MKYFVDDSGNYLGGTDGKPLSANEAPSAPNDAREIWDGEKWNMPLALIKEQREIEVRKAFNADANKPVVVNNITYHGGIDSAYRLDGALRLIEKAGLTEVSFTDIENVAHALTVAQANTVILSVGQDYQVKFMNKQQKMVDIKNAADEAAVNSITY